MIDETDAEFSNENWSDYEFPTIAECARVLFDECYKALWLAFISIEYSCQTIEFMHKRRNVDEKKQSNNTKT